MSIDSSSKLQFQETKEEEVDLRGDELHFHQEDCTTMHKPDQELVNNDDDDTLQMLRGFVEEFGVKGQGMMEKFVCRVVEEKEKIIHDIRGRPALVGKSKNSGGDKDYSTITERGVDVNIISEEGYKLERFKVKSVNLIGSGVVKQEEQ